MGFGGLCWADGKEDLGSSDPYDIVTRGSDELYQINTIVFKRKPGYTWNREAEWSYEVCHLWLKRSVTLYFKVSLLHMIHVVL